MSECGLGHRAGIASGVPSRAFRKSQVFRGQPVLRPGRFANNWPPVFAILAAPSRRTQAPPRTSQSSFNRSDDAGDCRGHVLQHLFGCERKTR